MTKIFPLLGLLAEQAQRRDTSSFLVDNMRESGSVIRQSHVCPLFLCYSFYSHFVHVDMAYKLLSEYGTNSVVTSLVDSFDFTILPVANPGTYTGLSFYISC